MYGRLAMARVLCPVRRRHHRVARLVAAFETPGWHCSNCVQHVFRSSPTGGRSVPLRIKWWKSPVIAFRNRNHSQKQSSPVSLCARFEQVRCPERRCFPSHLTRNGSSPLSPMPMRFVRTRRPTLPYPLQTTTSKTEVRSALEIFQRELRASGDAASEGGGRGRRRPSAAAPGDLSPFGPRWDPEYGRAVPQGDSSRF